MAQLKPTKKGIEIGNRIKKRYKEKGLTQKKLALLIYLKKDKSKEFSMDYSFSEEEIANAASTISVVNSHIKGKMIKLSDDYLTWYSEILDVSPRWLNGESPYMNGLKDYHSTLISNDYIKIEILSAILHLTNYKIREDNSYHNYKFERIEKDENTPDDLQLFQKIFIVTDDKGNEFQLDGNDINTYFKQITELIKPFFQPSILQMKESFDNIFEEYK